MCELTESPACESEEQGEAEEEQEREQEQEQEQRGTAPHYPITISDMSVSTLAPELGVHVVLTHLVGTRLATPAVGRG